MRGTCTGRISCVVTFSSFSCDRKFPNVSFCLLSMMLNMAALVESLPREACSQQ